jgi:hypothetical protein
MPLYIELDTSRCVLMQYQLLKQRVFPRSHGGIHSNTDVATNLKNLLYEQLPAPWKKTGRTGSTTTTTTTTKHAKSQTPPPTEPIVFWYA